ncbi:fumarate hydratase [Clostridiisalibacter paucivorans]|uniref:fumarate hydratase n=1 Tax=Clostridiisalibacter paucivorans TaxID=408753 RepID=UPI00047A6B7D|nr:fumarate hydratase [Clostridiisalibacter paucivorans]
MRVVNWEDIVIAIEKMCIKANCQLDDKLLLKIKEMRGNEESPIGQDILDKIIENSKIAYENTMPLCQDTGMAVFFVEMGQEVFIKGGTIKDAINEGVRRGYKSGYLRKSVVKDPIIRDNTKDNTPAIIHYDITGGDKLKIDFAPKGFGSENMGRLSMLKPSDGIEGIKNFVVETVEKAGPNPCPPLIVGVGIGGTMEKACILAKKSLFREVGKYNTKPHIKELEVDLLSKINSLGIGPQGLGGRTTALAVNIETYPTHIAGLPIAVNLNCHVSRHESIEI